MFHTPRLLTAFMFVLATLPLAGCGFLVSNGAVPIPEKALVDRLETNKLTIETAAASMNRLEGSGAFSTNSLSMARTGFNASRQRHNDLISRIADDIRDGDTALLETYTGSLLQVEDQTANYRRQVLMLAGNTKSEGESTMIAPIDPLSVWNALVNARGVALKAYARYFESSLVVSPLN